MSEDMNLRRRVIYQDVPLFMKTTGIMMMVAVATIEDMTTEDTITTR
jgi:hypothetical protein